MDQATLERLHDEIAELEPRLTKLIKFVGTDQFEALPKSDQADLQDQLYHMESYHQVLFRRIARHS